MTTHRLPPFGRLGPVLGAALALGAMSACVPTTVHAAGWPAPGMQVEVTVHFSPRAATLLAQRHEIVVAMGSFQGEPARGKEALAEPDGMILLGVVERTLGADGRASIGLPAGWEAKRSLVRPGELRLNVNVFSGRQASPDNMLACDFYEGSLVTAATRGLALNCRLFDEN